jgi:hypothetical protein
MPRYDAKKIGKIIARAWSDPGFKHRLSANSRATLAEMGIEVPAGVDVVIVENTPTKTHFVIPVRPAELSDTVIRHAANPGTDAFTLHTRAPQQGPVADTIATADTMGTSDTMLTGDTMQGPGVTPPPPPPPPQTMASMPG